MRPKQQEMTGSGDLFRARLDQIINMKHEMVRLAHTVAWPWLDDEVAPLFSDKGRPGLPTSFHAPEVECIGKGKANAPYEFGVKVSVTTTNARAKGGQFVLHAKALPGNPYDGHTLKDAIEETQALTGREIERGYADKGYRGHDAPKPLRIYLSGQKRGVFGRTKRELRHRSAIEAVISHMKNDGHLGRNYLKGREGDAANAILCAVGHNFRLILAWLRLFLRLLLATILATYIPRFSAKPAF